VPPADPRRDEQPELLPGLVRATLKESQAKARATRERKRREVEIAEVDPVARVLVDVPLAHLDRPFDYAVPAAMADDARPGVRVKVRFAGHDVDGFLVDSHIIAGGRLFGSSVFVASVDFVIGSNVVLRAFLVIGGDIIARVCRSFGCIV